MNTIIRSIPLFPCLFFFFYLERVYVLPLYFVVVWALEGSSLFSLFLY